MPKCPNCGRETLRTEDWACQWCGYPLLSSSYKMIPKTYRQLKEERLYRSEATFESEAEPVLESPREPMPEPEPEVEPVSERELELEPEATFESEAVPVPESQRESILEPERKVKPMPKRKPKPEPVAMDLTVDELLSAYATDEVAADVKFVNKLLRVTGVVAIIDVKDMLDTHYIRLTAAEPNFLQNVRCMFDKKHAPALKQLQKGQTITVQGVYNGSIIAIRMIDCALVQ